MTTVQSIIDNADNQAALLAFFKGVASCDYYDGTSYQLYLDLRDGSIFENQEVSDQSWLQRDDGSLVRIASVSGYCDIPEEECYTDGCSLSDYGWADWLEEIEARIAQALESA